MTALAETIDLGPGGPRVRPLGIGTWQWGDRLLWGYGRRYRAADLAAAYQAALAADLTLFDTAEVYGRGRSERLLGAFNRLAGGRAVVATKFMPYPWRLRPLDLERALRGSLRRLGAERVDLYQVHWPFPPGGLERWALALDHVAQAGLARAVGVSNYSADQMRRTHAILAARGRPLATNQVEYSLLQRRVERNGVLAACRELGVVPIAYSPLGLGLLGGRYHRRAPPPGWRRRLYDQKGPERVDALVGLLGEIGQAHGGKSPAQVALNWLICQGALPIPGARGPEQVRQNAGALGWRLTPDELAALDRASSGF